MKEDTQKPGTLEQVRARSSYPQLRELIALAYWLGIVAGGLLGVVLIVAGVAIIGDTAASASGFPQFWLGIVALVFTWLWIVAFRPAASLLVDIADLLVELVRQGRRDD